MKSKNVLALSTVAGAALLLTLLAVRWPVSQKEPEQFVAKSQAIAIDDLVSQRIRSEYGDRATLTRALQTKGMTIERFRQQVEQEVEASLIDELVNQRIRSEYGDRATLVRMLQEKGITLEGFRQQLKQEANISSH